VLIVTLPPFPARQPWTRGLAITAALALLAGGLLLGKMWQSQAANLVLGLAVTFLIWVTLHCAVAPLPCAYSWLAQRSARSSYTLYLVHLPMLVFLKASLHLPRALPTSHMCLVGIGLLAGTMLYAQLVYQVFEKHTDRVRNWIKPYVMGSKAA
jgi:peptidoglycan/LPS O-acetylase OafA/YrhL